MEILYRPRRNRRTAAVRSLVRETRLHPGQFVMPVFVEQGKGIVTSIAAMPGVNRYSPDTLVTFLKEVEAAGIPGVALFPKIEDSLKDSHGTIGLDPKGLVPEMIDRIKSEIPNLSVFTDIALDPYSCDGHDGVVENGQIINDVSVEILAQMAVMHAEAGADWVSPSDMMDGRIAEIRIAMDQSGHTDTGIMSYAAKYASAFYGPFRDALDSAPKAGDKKTYQMDPANAREAIKEVEIDICEGADMVMVKPALSYLDIIKSVKERFTVPVSAYHVSGEYSMICAAAERGWLNKEQAMMESLLSISRAGADCIWSYYALEAARLID
jgi:porphobilinogen synthase